MTDRTDGRTDRNAGICADQRRSSDASRERHGWEGGEGKGRRCAGWVCRDLYSCLSAGRSLACSDEHNDTCREACMPPPQCTIVTVRAQPCPAKPKLQPGATGHSAERQATSAAGEMITCTWWCALPTTQWASWTANPWGEAWHLCPDVWENRMQSVFCHVTPTVAFGGRDRLSKPR